MHMMWQLGLYSNFFEHLAFMLVMLLLSIMSFTWIFKRYCPAKVLLPFVLLALLTMDSGLLTGLEIVTHTLGFTIPSRHWVEMYSLIPLTCAVGLSIWAIISICLKKYSLYQALGVGLVGIGALVASSCGWWIHPMLLLIKSTQNYLPCIFWVNVIAFAASATVLLGAALLMIGSRKFKSAPDICQTNPEHRVL